MIFSRQVVCKKCGEHIPTDCLVSTNTGGNQHTDLYQENIGTQAIHYMLTVCPSCQFVDYNDEFEVFKEYDFIGKEKEPTKEIRALMKKYPPTRRFIMLAERLAKESAPKMDIADSYLKASWAERMANADFWFPKRRKQESRELEKNCQEKAAEYFSQALMNEETEATTDLFYLIGELHRRTGNFRAAIEYFEKAKKALLAEELFNVVLDDIGPRRPEIIDEISKQKSISKAEADVRIDRLPYLILEVSEPREAEEKANIFEGLGAKISIQKVKELTPENEDFLILIEQMNLFAWKKDSSHKVIEKL
jgi:tetratricopeptide (TPR) repeat protein